MAYFEGQKKGPKNGDQKISKSRFSRIFKLLCVQALSVASRSSIFLEGGCNFQGRKTRKPPERETQKQHEGKQTRKVFGTKERFSPDDEENAPRKQLMSRKINNFLVGNLEC